MSVTMRVLMLAGIISVMGGVKPARAQCQIQKILALDGAALDHFGNYVAISGNVAVIGAANQGNQGSNLGFGKAYVFEFNGARWSEVAQLTPSDPETDKEFGDAVAIDGDTIVVGAGQDGGGIGVGAGAAYVYVKPTLDGWGSMTETAKLTASDAAVADVFGLSVGISGDVVVVGALNNQDAGASTGSAYIFKKPAGGWVDMTETQKLLALDATAQDRFGRGVAIDGSTVMIGADQVNNGSGKAYIFELQTGTWVETAKLTPSDGAAGDRFGEAVAIRGGLVVAGAFRDDDGGSQSGSAYVFERPGTGWVDMTQSAKLRALAPAAGDNFGISVSISAAETVLVGAYEKENPGSAGSAYLFDKPGGGWVDMTETAKLVASDGAPNDEFGVSVSIDTDIAIIGANRDDDNGDTSGSACMFAIPTTPIQDSDGDGVIDACDQCPGFNDAEPCPIPAVSEWGLAVMALLTLTVGTVFCARRRATPA